MRFNGLLDGCQVLATCEPTNKPDTYPNSLKLKNVKLQLIKRCA